MLSGGIHGVRSFTTHQVFLSFFFINQWDSGPWCYLKDRKETKLPGLNSLIAFVLNCKWFDGHCRESLFHDMRRMSIYFTCFSKKKCEVILSFTTRPRWVCHPQRLGLLKPSWGYTGRASVRPEMGIGMGWVQSDAVIEWVLDSRTKGVVPFWLETKTTSVFLFRQNLGISSKIDWFLMSTCVAVLDSHQGDSRMADTFYLCPGAIPYH